MAWPSKLHSNKNNDYRNVINKLKPTIKYLQNNLPYSGRKDLCKQLWQ